MKKRKSSKASLGDVARAAGVSRVAAGYAMKNQPGVSKTTREKVLRVARRLGYAPDARIASWMQRVREAKSKDLLPIAWLNSKPWDDAWHTLEYLTPYLEGARARALGLGYRLEEIWARQPGMTMRRISKILYQRGIEGVIVSQPARHIRLDWTRLSGISIDGSLLAPGLHRVMTDTVFNLNLALKSLKRLGYRRIGICLTKEVDSFSAHGCRAAAYYFHGTTPRADQVPPLFYVATHGMGKQFGPWLRRYEPEVIVGLDSQMLEGVEEAGYRVAKDIGVVHLSVDDDVLDWAGIYSNKREIGATAAEWVISLLQNHRFGLPKVLMNTLVPGTWRLGRTLVSPKARIT